MNRFPEVYSAMIQQKRFVLLPYLVDLSVSVPYPPPLYFSTFSQVSVVNLLISESGHYHLLTSYHFLLC